MFHASASILRQCSMTVAGVGHKAPVYRSGAVTDKRDGNSAGFLLLGMQPHTGSAVQNGKAKLPFTVEFDIQPGFCESRLNANAVAGQTSLFGINLNRLRGLRGTNRYGMFTQWVRSNLMGPC
jgi:hypothetical protein